ncbi:MAG: methionyl-tRNA formyltransferase [Peptococcia bacterium]|jgi:methionyl-tRNA formyltransferase
MIRIVFMGTPEFAVPVLEKLSQTDKIEIVAVVTQPDRPRGRGKQLTFSPVKEKALALGLQVLQPERVREEDFLKRLQELKPDLIIVAAFGQILPQEILTLPPHGCLNVHASLLPAYRGAAPIQRAILQGEEKTGISIMLMEQGLDTGDVLAEEEVPIPFTMNYGELHDALAIVGAELLARTVPRWLAGLIEPVPQEKITERKPGYASPLRRDDEIISWANPAEMIYNQIRGLAPVPGAYTIFQGKPLKIRESEPVNDDLAGLKDEQQPVVVHAPGTVVALLKGKGFVVQTGSGCLLIKQVQLVGKNIIPAQSFLNGYHLEVGYVFNSIEERTSK